MRTGLVKKTFTIMADPNTMQRFERFLALMHYNGGHTAVFAMPFDGDGNDVMYVDPAPPAEYREEVGIIAGAGPDVEEANANNYLSFYVDTSRNQYRICDHVLARRRPGSNEWELVGRKRAGGAENEREQA